MNTANVEPNEKKERVFLGIIGAFLFSLVGGAVYVGLSRLGFIAGIAGAIAAIGAIKGYTLFSKGHSKKGVIIAAVISLITIVLAEYVSLTIDVKEAYDYWYEIGDVDYVPTFFEAFSIAYLFLEVPEVLKDFLIDLAFGILLCALGAMRPIMLELNRVKAAKNAEMQVVNQQTDDEFDDGDRFADNREYTSADQYEEKEKNE